jgi:two-component system response regulator TctD
VNTLAARVLLVEDNPALALWLGTALRRAGMVLEIAPDGRAAQQALRPRHGFDAVVLDLQIPGPDGLTVLQALREAGDPVPVLILTARASVPDRVFGLNLGADDYLPKPFELSELEARLGALLRRPGRLRGEQLRLGPLAMDLRSGEVNWDGRVLALTPRETAALRVLLASARRTVAKEALHAAVFADDGTGLDAVEVLVHRLRRKLEAQPRPGVEIATFRGLGYMLTTSRDG